MIDAIDLRDIIQSVQESNGVEKTSIVFYSKYLFYILILRILVTQKCIDEHIKLQVMYHILSQIVYIVIDIILV